MTENIGLGPRWVEVNLGALKHNYQAIREKIGSQVKLLGVVKADAYGLGAVEVSRVLEETGIDMLAVTSAAEGQQLREAGITVPILVFRPFTPEEVSLIARWNLTATVASKAAILYLKEWLEIHGGKITVHLKVETGMGRYGFWPEEAIAAAQEILSTPGLLLEGVYTHLATAMWKNKAYSRKQFQVFQETCVDLKKAGINGLIRHIANSAAIIELPEMYLDMVRAGTILYGQNPDPQLKKLISLKDTWCFKAKVIYIRELPQRHSVGYGRTFRSRRPLPVAVLPVGYVDGVQLEPLLKPASVLDLLKGTVKLILTYVGWDKFRAPVQFPGGEGRIIGKVGMQLTMVDVSGVKDLAVGTTACVPVRRTAINAIIPKVYKEEGKTLSMSITITTVKTGQGIKETEYK